jgi:hypothetical protein
MVRAYITCDKIRVFALRALHSVRLTQILTTCLHTYVPSFSTYLTLSTHIYLLFLTHSIYSVYKITLTTPFIILY